MLTCPLRGLFLGLVQRQTDKERIFSAHTASYPLLRPQRVLSFGDATRLGTKSHRQNCYAPTKSTAKTLSFFCRLAHLPVARSNLTLGSSPMICGGFYAEASPRRRLKTTEGIDHFSSALALRREIFSLFISFSTLFLHQYYVKFFIFSFKISVIFVKLLRHIFSILQYYFAMRE